MTDLDATISKAHLAAEQTENKDRAIEARIAQFSGAAKCLPTRRYGNAINAGDIASNMTLNTLIARHDHQLAAYLGCANGDHRRREEAEAARALQAESLRLKTEETRARNQAAAEARSLLRIAPQPCRHIARDVPAARQRFRTCAVRIQRWCPFQPLLLPQGHSWPFIRRPWPVAASVIACA